MSCLCSSFLPTNSQTSDNPRSSPYVSDHATRYFGSVGSDFVHAASCSKARNTPKINRVYYDSVRAAVNDGRVRCADCLSSSPNKNSSTSSDSPTYKPVTPPLFNGEVIYEISSDRIAPLTIKTSGSDSYLVKLKKSGSGEDVLSVYVCGGESIDIDVPLGTFKLVYASGSVWYGPTHLFGEDTSYAKADELFEFYEEDGYVNGWTVSLYPVSNGNLDTTPIDPEEF